MYEIMYSINHSFTVIDIEGGFMVSVDNGDGVILDTMEEVEEYVENYDILNDDSYVDNEEEE